jgi:hypothetical protein
MVFTEGAVEGLGGTVVNASCYNPCSRLADCWLLSRLRNASVPRSSQCGKISRLPACWSSWLHFLFFSLCVWPVCFQQRKLHLRVTRGSTAAQSHELRGGSTIMWSTTSTWQPARWPPVRELRCWNELIRLLELTDGCLWKLQVRSSPIWSASPLLRHDCFLGFP